MLESFINGNKFNLSQERIIELLKKSFPEAPLPTNFEIEPRNHIHENIQFETSKIAAVLKDLKPSKSPGISGINYGMLKREMNNENLLLTLKNLYESILNSP